MNRTVRPTNPPPPPAASIATLPSLSSVNSISSMAPIDVANDGVSPVAPEPRSPRRMRLLGRARPPLVREAATPIHLGSVDRRKGSALLIARFDLEREALEPILAAIRPRAIDVRPLDTISAEIPTTLARALRRAAKTSFAWAGALGALGAILGALLMPSDTFLPPFGWISGPLGGSAWCGGIFGALGFVLGTLALLFSPRLALPSAGPGVLVLVRARAFDIDAIVSHVVEAGGTISAVGEAT